MSATGMIIKSVLVFVLFGAFMVGSLWLMSTKTEEPVPAVGTSETTAPVRLAVDGNVVFSIVLRAEPLEMERFAAEELAKYLEKIIGARPIITDKRGEQANIFVGCSDEIRQMAADVDWTALGTDGIVIRTVGSDLVLSGGEPHGPLFAVYAFLQDVLGCRWWTREAEMIPSRSPR